MERVVVALNQVRDSVKVLISGVDFMSKSPCQQLMRKYLDNEEVCSIFHVSDRTLFEIRNEGELDFIKVRRKIIYRASDVYQYLERRFAKVRRY